MGAALPFSLATPENPTAPSQEVWDTLIKGFRDSRADFVHAALPSSLGTTAGAVIPEKTLERYERIVDDADAIAIERCIQIITASDFTNELQSLGKTTLPILCLHGDKDTSCPVEASAEKVKEIIPRVIIKVYANAGHGKLPFGSAFSTEVDAYNHIGTYLTHKDQTIDDILEFVDALNMSKAG